MRRTTILSILLLSFVTGALNAQGLIWTVGLPGDGWPDNLGEDGGPQTIFTVEGGTNDLPGDADSGLAPGAADDDYYFAGVYDTVLDGSDYESWGEVFDNERVAERAIHTEDPSLRYHFNLPEDLGPGPLSVQWDVNVIDIFGGHPPEDAKHGVEVYFNGRRIAEETIIRPSDLGTINETPSFTIEELNGELGEGFDNYVELRGVSYAAEGGGNWVGIDHVSLHQSDPACESICPPSEIGGAGEVATNVLESSTANHVFQPGGGDTLPGLGQSWYAVANPGGSEFNVVRGNHKDVVFSRVVNSERAVPYFHGEEGTWWSGSGAVNGVQNYPIELGAVEDGGVISGDDYTVILDGEILIPKSTIKFLDGVDDFAYLAIDMDRSGIPGDSEGEVIINDNIWTNASSVANGGAPIVEVDFEDIGPDGEWLAVLFAMAEGGSGDHGMLYWDALDEFGDFPIEQGEGVTRRDGADLQIPDTHLRGPSEPPTLVSGEATASPPVRLDGQAVTGWAFDVNPADGTSDQFVTENPDVAIFSTSLNVDELVLHINPLSDPADGDSFQVFVADTVNGMPSVATEGWTYDSTTGSVVFGQLVGCNPDSLGDFDGSGTVDFLDFLRLAQNFGDEVSDHTFGDADCNGTVDFLDFLALATNFGKSAASASAESVPEPSGLWLMNLAATFCGLMRRRRSCPMSGC